MQTFLPIVEEVEGFLMDRGMLIGVWWTGVILISNSNLILTGSKRNTIHVPSYDKSRSKCCINSARSGYSETNIYVSKILLEAEMHYLPLEKANLVVIHATWKLPHYFQAHTVVVLIEHPLQALLRRNGHTIFLWC